MQSYKGKAPPGIGPIPNVKGSDAKGMAFADVEYDWTLTHEDLRIPSLRVLETELTPDRFGGPEHGTAVLGILSSIPNSFGVTGIAPGAFAYVASASSTELGYMPARAIGIAMNKLRAGDVIIIEQQSPVCGLEDFGPLEYYQDVFDAVSAATAKGIIVVAAAGNGDVNLDRATCGGFLDRTKRDSQAIIVGAGSSTDRTKLSFSSYGSRVDVQGWGENVTTTGYGDAYNPTNDVRRYYTKSFNGTSSATPIVAGTVLVIQGVRKACGLPPATPLEMRDLLVPHRHQARQPAREKYRAAAQSRGRAEGERAGQMPQAGAVGERRRAAVETQAARFCTSASVLAAATKSRHRFLRRSAASASSPHWLISQSSSTWAAFHAAPPACRRPCATARASSADPVNVVITCRAARLKVSRPSSGSLSRAERGLRLCDMRDALGEKQRRAQRGLGPGQHRVPMRLLRLDQCVRPRRPVAKQIGARMRHDVIDHSLLAPDHAVDGAVGDPGQRHGERIDALTLRAPLLGDRLGKRPRRQSQSRLAGSSYRLAVELERGPLPPPSVSVVTCL